MTRAKSMLVLAFALLSLGAINATTAFAEENALPHVLFLPGTESGQLNATCLTVGSCESAFAGIRPLKATKYLFEFIVEKDMVDGGPAKLLFEGTELESKKCSTSGDSETNGTVLIDNATWQFSYTLTEPKKLIVVVTIPEFVIKCVGGLNIKVRGKSIASLSPLNSETTSFTSLSNCSGTGNKTPEFSEYDVDAIPPGMETAKLESSIGLGFEKSCQQEQGTVSLTATQMAEIM